MKLTLDDVELEGARTTVIVDDCRVVLLGGERVDSDVAIDGKGGALLPGLHDHHLHLLAMAAPSVECGEAGSIDQLRAALRAAASGEWVRARGYHESIAGELDRHTLDAIVPDRPVRVQHRGGALWMLNSLALQRVSHVLDDSADVERDANGEPTGRLWRYDERLRPALPKTDTDLRAVGDELLRYGITGVTDATPDLDSTAIELIAGAHARGELPQDVTLLGAPDDWSPRPGVEKGPAKLLLRDHDLPGVDEIAGWIAARHDNGRAVAIHCVTSDALTLVIGALDGAGPRSGDRIEHASVVPPGLRPDLVRLGVRVVTQPDFLRTRGDDYVRDVEASEQPFLYPYCSLEQAGVATVPSSDAPYGALDPWQVVRSARDRTSRNGHALNPDESVPVTTALGGYLTDPITGAPRRLAAGAAGSLVLLDAPLEDVLREPDADRVRLVCIGGQVATA